jgi:protein gp37
LWSLIRSTPMLDWFLLTKRPQNIREMLPTDWGDGWPHVWLGTTTENQEEANRRIPHLVAVPAAVRFLSVEPMLELVDVAPWLVLPSQDGRAPLSWIIVGVNLAAELARCIRTGCEASATKCTPPAPSSS